VSKKEASLPKKRIHCNQMLPLTVRKCTVPSDHLRSEISSHELAAFQIIGKAR